MDQVDFHASVLESLDAIRETQAIIVKLLTDPAGKKRKKRLTEQQKAILAVGAVANKGCETLQEVADEIGISQSAAAKSPGIRRAIGLDAPIRDVARGFQTEGGQIESYDGE